MTTELVAEESTIKTDRCGKNAGVRGRDGGASRTQTRLPTEHNSEELMQLIESVTRAIEIYNLTLCRP